MLLSTILAFANCQDWTCEECAEGGEAVGEFLSATDQIIFQIIFLEAELCPQHPDPDYCTQNLPEFWASIAPMIWKTHFSYICDDLQCVQERVSIPSCEACLGRVNGAADALAWEETITGWITGK